MSESKKLSGKQIIEMENTMLDYKGEDRVVTSHELAEELKKIDASVFRIMTGLPSLDRLLDGVEAGELIVVTGPTGEGKTTLLMSITKNMAASNIESIWFTLEVTPRQFLAKLVKAQGDDEAKLPMFYIPRAGYEDIDIKILEQFKKKHNREFQMIDWIEYKIIEAKLKAEQKGNTLKAVFIDHIHMIFSIAKVERNISLEIGDMVAKIKNIAIENNLAVFLIAHTKDDPQGSLRDPRKEDIRDSGLISRLADTIIGVWRIPNKEDGEKTRRTELSEDDRKAKIRIFKNRRTGKLGYFVAYHEDHCLTEDMF